MIIFKAGNSNVISIPKCSFLWGKYSKTKPLCILYYASFMSFLKVDADFALDLLGELVRAYSAATNISYQVSR